MVVEPADMLLLFSPRFRSVPASLVGGVVTKLRAAVSAHRRDRLRGWGGRTRTAESVGIEVRPCCRGISADLAEMAQLRRFAFELRHYQRAAAARIWPGVART